jgi:ribose-phosphate pyrophosphokinase
MNRNIGIDGVNHDPGIYGTAIQGVCKDWTFSAGEHGIQFYTGAQQLEELHDRKAPFFIFLHNADGRAIMETLNTSDALRRMGYEDVRLIMAYVPYGRQDRVTTPGTGFGLAMFSRVINTAKFDEVIVVDPHSKVTAELIDNIRVISPAAAMEFFPKNQLQGLVNDLVIVAPDKGAVDRAAACAEALGVPEERIIYATKERDPSTGYLKTTGVSGYAFQPDDELLFIDDICDGGATFLELAKFLKDQGLKKKPSLYVTHGIFSKGLDEMYQYFHAVVSTNSFFRSDVIMSSEIKCRWLPKGSVIPIELLMAPYWNTVSVREVEYLHHISEIVR